MKKILTGAILALTISAGITAFADGTATYDQESNSVTDVAAEGYKTVLIAKTPEEGASVSGDDIVHVDQVTSGFGATIDFALKTGAQAGNYTLTLGGGTGDAAKLSFVIGAETTVADLKMTHVGSEERTNDEGEKVHSVGFTVENAEIKNYSSLKVTLANADETTTTLGYGLETLLGTTLSGAGEVSFGLQINNVPDGMQTDDKIAAYLSADVIQ